MLCILCVCDIIISGGVIMFDVIVFTQYELIKAVQAKHGSICLCDNVFTIPPVKNISYIALGDVTAKAECTRTEAVNNNIIFEGFEPEFLPPDTVRHGSLVSSGFGSYIYLSAENYNGIWVSGYGINLI